MFPSWYWQVGFLGQVKWRRSYADLPLPGKQEDDPPWFECDTPTQDLNEMEVVWVQGTWPETTNPIWLMKSLKVAIGIVEVQKARRRQQQTKRALPPGWQVAHQYHIAQSDFSGVTDGVFRVTVRSRLGIDVVYLPASHVPGVLGEALDNLTTGVCVD